MTRSLPSPESMASCLADVKDQLELLSLSIAQHQHRAPDVNGNFIHDVPRRSRHQSELSEGSVCLPLSPPPLYLVSEDDVSNPAGPPPWSLHSPPPSSHHSPHQSCLGYRVSGPPPPPPATAYFSSSHFDSMISERKQQWLDGALTDLILKTYTHRRQPKSLLDYKCSLQEMITRCLANYLAGPNGGPLQFKIYLIGSSLTSIGSSRSDIDLCMVIYNADTGAVDDRFHNRIYAESMLEKISAILSKAGLAYQSKVIRANVPILKFFDHNHIEVNLNLNKLVTVQNTMLLVHLCSLDARVAPFLFIAKLWAQKNGINCAYFKSLSSYSLSLMAIFYLQNICQPSILPPFSQLIDYVVQSTSLFKYQESSRPKDSGLHVTSSVPFDAFSLLDRLSIPSPPPPPPPPPVIFEDNATATAAAAAAAANADLHHLHQLHQLKAPELSGSAISRVTFLESSHLPSGPSCSLHHNGKHDSWQVASPAPLPSGAAGPRKGGRKKGGGGQQQHQQPHMSPNQVMVNFAEASLPGITSAVPGTGLEKNLPYYYYYYYYYYCHQFQLLSNGAVSPPVKNPHCAGGSNSDGASDGDSSCSSSLSGSTHSLLSSGAASICEFKSSNKQSLGALFAGFINFYSDQSVFDSVISVRTGRLMKRTDPTFARSSMTSMDTFICVEEPFNHTNTSHSVHNDFMFNFIVKSFKWTRDSINKMKLSVNDFV